MRVLALTHGPLVRPELFGDVVRADGHDLDEWSLPDEESPPRRPEDYDAAFVFGGGQNVGEERAHPWLVGEYDVLRSLVERRIPTFGVCLGAQLLAHALGGDVGPSPEPERGFVPVELTDAARGDAVFGSLPERFDAFHGHVFAFEVPPGAVELARSRVCPQAFRAGACAWGVQFHPEIRIEQVRRWWFEEEQPPPPNAERLLAELEDRYAEWSAFGASLCRSFLAAAERLAAVR